MLPPTTPATVVCHGSVTARLTATCSCQVYSPCMIRFHILLQVLIIIGGGEIWATHSPHLIQGHTQLGGVKVTTYIVSIVCVCTQACVCVLCVHARACVCVHACASELNFRDGGAVRPYLYEVFFAYLYFRILGCVIENISAKCFILCSMTIEYLKCNFQGKNIIPNIPSKGVKVGQSQKY